MVKLFKRTLTLVTRQQTNILSAATVIMLTVALSRILGLARDRMLAGYFTPEELGVYYAAFRLPNMLFELLVMGTLSTAFIPVFTAQLDTKGKDHAFMLASSLINIGTLVFFISCIPLVLFTHGIARMLAPGFNPDQIEIMVSFTRIMLVAQVLPLIVGNFFTGILQSMRNFLLPALAPVVYNVGIIFAIAVFAPSMGLYAPVIGVVIGAVLFALIQIPAVVSYGYRHKWQFSWNYPGTREVGKLMLPRTLGLAVAQIDITIDLILSTLLGASAVTVFNFAQHLQQVPIGLFGASIAQATLPALSSHFAKERMEEYRRIFGSSFLQILFFVLPLSVLFIVLRIPMVRLVFGASNLFDWESTVMTGKTLAFFSVSLFAQAVNHLLARSFYAAHESKLPFVAGAISVGVNTALSLLFILGFHWGVWSLGLSTSIASILNSVFLLLFLEKKIGKLFDAHVVVTSIKIILAAIVSGLALYIPLKLLDQLVFDTTRTINLMALTGISTAAGLSVYLFFAWFLDVPQVATVASMWKRLRPVRQSVVIDPTGEMQ